MLSQFDINHIKGAFDDAEECGLSDKAKLSIAYCRRLIEHAENKALMKFTGSANAKTAAAYIDRMSAECEWLGTKD